MGQVLKKMLAAFHTKKLELVLVGLENSGKTTLMNVLAYGHAVDTCPTVGLNVKVVRKGGVMLKCWDVGGQQHYRSEWGRYTRGCDVIIYVVDAYAQDRVPSAKKELHRLLEDRELAKTPLLVLANKIDLKPHMSERDLIKDETPPFVIGMCTEMNLDYIVDNPWIVIPISALHTTNIDQVLTWLVKQAKSQPVE